MTAMSVNQRTYEQVESDFWKKSGETQPRQQKGSGIALVYQAAIDAARKASLADETPSNIYGDRLEKAKELLDDIRRALSSDSKEKAETGVFWQLPPVLSVANLDGVVHPIDSERLARAAKTYLGLPWMQFNLLDWYLFNAFIFDALARLLEESLSGAAFGRVDWAYLLADGHGVKTAGYRLVLECVKFAARWLLIPSFIVLLFYWKRAALVAWLAVPYSLYVAYRIVTLASRWKAAREEAHRRKELGRKAELFCHAYTTANSEAFSPTRLLEQLKATEDCYTLLAPVTYALLQRAILRDSALFSV